MAIMMDYRDVILLLIGVIVGLVSWFLKELWSLHKRLDRDVSELGKRLPVEFASKVDVREIEARLNDKIDGVGTSIISRVDAFQMDVSGWFSEIGDKLDRKADKK